MTNNFKDIMDDYGITHYELAIILVLFVLYTAVLKYKTQWIITTVTIDHYLTQT